MLGADRQKMRLAVEPMIEIRAPNTFDEALFSKDVL